MRNDYKDTVSGFFNGRSDYRKSKLHSEMAERFLLLAAPQPGERVLDIATGTGFVSIPCASLVGEKGGVVGVDISPGMLEQAAEDLEAAGLKNLELVEADAENLDYPGESFDLITCCNALPYMSDVPRALSNWLEFLRPGGRLVFNCWSENSHATGRLPRAVAASHGIAMPVAGWDTGTPERCRATLKGAGYSHIEVIVEPTIKYWSADKLFEVFEAALSSPLFGVSPADRDRMEALRAEYTALTQTADVLESVKTEMGAYFVSATR